MHQTAGNQEHSDQSGPLNGQSKQQRWVFENRANILEKQLLFKRVA